MRLETGIAGYDRADWSPLAPVATALCLSPRMGVLVQRDPGGETRGIEASVPAGDDPCIIYLARACEPVDANVGGQRRLLRPSRGQILALPAGADSWWRHHGDMGEIYHLHLRPSLVALAAEDHTGGHMPLIWPTTDATAEQVLRLVLEEASRGSPTGTVYGESLVVALVTRLGHVAHGQELGEARSYALAPARRRRVLNFIEANLCNDIGLAEMAGVAGLSSWHFIRAFRKEMGLPPHQYLLQRRCELARSLLMETNQSVEAVAKACGFGTTSHFSTVFRRLVGTSPSAWRRAAVGDTRFDRAGLDRAG